MLLTAGRFRVPDGFARTVLFDGFFSAAFVVADLAAAGTVFFAVRDFTADLAAILRELLFIADFAATCLPASAFVVLALAVWVDLRVVFATPAFMARSRKQFPTLVVEK